MSPDPNAPSFFKRPRLNQLLAEAAKRPVVIICAGAGYGKTHAVSDFLSQQDLPVAWEQLSDLDNVALRSWENVTHSFMQMNKQLGEAFIESGLSGFPDTEEKCKQFYHLYERHMPSKQQYMLVIDDFHFLKNQAVLYFVNFSINYLPSNRKSVFIISREPLPINLSNLEAKGLVSNISGEDLNFTESELAEYLDYQGLSVNAQTLREIFQDTKGWAFAVNFIVQSLKKAPNYSGYVRSAMKKNFFQLMETDVYNMVSERLRRFLARLSLVGHLSADLVAALAEGDKDLLDELGRQSAFVRFESYINAYMIHHLFLDFLRTKQDILSGEEKRRTYQIAADWCNRNDFKIDALAYFEKIGDYESIVSIFRDFPLQVPRDIAPSAEHIFDRAPHDTFERVTFFAGTHVRVVMSRGKLLEAFDLIALYEAKLLRLPEDDLLRNRTLSDLYYCWGFMRQLMCTIDDLYNFDIYFAKMDEYLAKSSLTLSELPSYPVGPWFSLVGAPRKGALQEYIDALTRAVAHSRSCSNGCMAGADDLARGELKFFQGDLRSAESFMLKGIERAREHKQFGLVHRALFYMIRIAFAQGDYAMAERALKDTEALLDETGFPSRFLAYDITLGAYYNFTLQPDMVPGWMKETFTPRDYTYFNENSANHIKAYYNFITRNYDPLLAYLEELKRQESTLFGRIDLLVMKACVLFKTKDKAEAFFTLRKAYEIASPNDLLTPFTRFGKDMRTLASAALLEPDFGVPKPWLEMVARRSATIARRRIQFVSDYNKTHGVKREITLSPREMEVLRNMYHGLSRSEIAANLQLSSNTVKLYINNIYGKLNARNLADVIRIAAQQKLV